MERLTEWIQGERRAIPRMELRNNGYEKCTIKLAEYEDTGLMPEQVQQLKEREELFMDYIMCHAYSCPIKDDADIDFEKECVGFEEPGCRECIMRHLKELRGMRLCRY